MAAIRSATADDVDAVVDFAEHHVVEHYRPLLGDAAARAQVDDWWTHERLRGAAAEGRLVVATDAEGDVVGVAEWSLYDGHPTVWKLYVHGDRRGEGLGPRLLDAVTASLPDGADRLLVEHFAVSEDAARFYDREGFRAIRTVRGSDPSLDVVWRERPLAA